LRSGVSSWNIGLGISRSAEFIRPIQPRNVLTAAFHRFEFYLADLRSSLPTHTIFSLSIEKQQLTENFCPSRAGREIGTIA
jgi:hypothetical protein